MRRPWGILRIGVAVLVVGYGVGMGLLALYLRRSGDVTPWGMLLLFGPRWVLLLPWIVLVPAAWLAGRRVAVAALMAALFTAAAVAGFETPSISGAAPARHAIRLVTYNTDRSPQLPLTIREDLRAWHADLVILQDCHSALTDSLRAAAGDRAQRVSEFCIVSALPIRRIDELPPPSPGVPRTSAVRIEVETSNGPVAVFGVHFQSPRDALWAARNLDFALLERSIAQRSINSRRVAEWVGRAGMPVVVAGDFNIPQGSTILRRDWGALRNAFSARGWGFGYTMFAGKFAVRIDHVLVDPALVTERVELPRGYPSEHQPVVVDIAWPAR